MYVELKNYKLCKSSIVLAMSLSALTLNMNRGWAAEEPTPKCTTMIRKKENKSQVVTLIGENAGEWDKVEDGYDFFKKKRVHSPLGNFEGVSRKMCAGSMCFGLALFLKNYTPNCSNWGHRYNGISVVSRATQATSMVAGMVLMGSAVGEVFDHLNSEGVKEKLLTSISRRDVTRVLVQVGKDALPDLILELRKKGFTDQQSLD